jgi:hypothetical protein
MFTSVNTNIDVPHAKPLDMMNGNEMRLLNRSYFCCSYLQLINYLREKFSFNQILMSFKEGF